MCPGDGHEIAGAILINRKPTTLVLTGIVTVIVALALTATASAHKRERGRAIGFVAPSVPTTTAAAGPVPMGWLQVVNYYRDIAGVAPITENGNWSERNAKHARWMIKNQSLQHGENEGTPFYTPAGNVAGQRSNLLHGNWGQSDRTSIEQWLVAPFHGAGILDPYLKKSGYADYQESRPPGQVPYAAALDVLSGQSGTPGPSTWPVRFPGPDEKIYLRSYPGTEHPQPLSSTGCTGFSAPTGPPIYLMLNVNPAGVSSATSSFEQDGTPLQFCIFDENTYTNPVGADQSLGRGALDSRNAIVLIPKDPFQSNKTYDVMITSNGTPYSWSFEVGDLVAPTTTIEKPANGQTYDRDNFNKIKGTATGNPVRVEVELYRDYGTLCRYWMGNKFSDKRACSQPKWLKATGTDNWSLSLPKLPASTGTPNGYVVHSRGIDNVGNTETYTGFNFLGFNLKP